MRLSARQPAPQAGPRLTQIGRVKAFGEPTQYGLQQGGGSGSLSLLPPVAGEAYGRRAAPGLRLLPAGRVESPLEMGVGLLRVCARTLLQQRPLQSVQLGLVEPFLSTLDHLQGSR